LSDTVRRHLNLAPVLKQGFEADILTTQDDAVKYPPIKMTKGNTMTLTRGLTLFTAVAGLMLASSAINAAAVYKVSKGEDYLFVGGTIHILTEADFPLAPAYETAYSAADELVFETDLAAFKDPAIMQKVGPVMMQPPGQKLSQQLSEDTAKALTAHLIERGLPILQFEAMSATGAMLTLTVMEFQAKGFLSEGVDAFYHAKGTEQGKNISWLESVDSQIALLDSFDNGDPNALIAYTLKDIDKGAETIDALHKAWKKGDLAKLEQTGMLEMKRDFPQVYQDVMVDRNVKWMPQIEAMFEDNDVEYVLVGALHLAGDDGILEMLEAKGYTVERL
jgi:hypothetical protein